MHPAIVSLDPACSDWSATTQGHIGGGTVAVQAASHRHWRIFIVDGELGQVNDAHQGMP